MTCDCSVDPSERLLLLILRNNASPDFPLIQTMIIHSTLPSEIVSTSILIFHVYNNLETEFSRYYCHGGKNRDRNLGGISLLSQGEEKTRNEPKYPIFRHHLFPGAHAEGGQAVMRQERGSLSRGGGGRCELSTLHLGNRGVKARECTHNGVNLQWFLGYFMAHALLPV